LGNLVNTEHRSIYTGKLKTAYRDTRLNNPNFLLLTLLADFLYLRLDRVLLYLVWAQLLVDALDEKRDAASFKSCNL